MGAEFEFESVEQASSSIVDVVETDAECASSLLRGGRRTFWMCSADVECSTLASSGWGFFEFCKIREFTFSETLFITVQISTMDNGSIILNNGYVTRPLNHGPKSWLILVVTYRDT